MDHRLPWTITEVYDDATDWYSEAANPWLSEKQREEASRIMEILQKFPVNHG